MGSGGTQYSIAARQTGIVFPSIKQFEKTDSEKSCKVAGMLLETTKANLNSKNKLLGCYMVKPHGQLVQVSFAFITVLPHPAYQRRSLRQTFRDLKGPGKSNLEGGFPLRCFQRLSLPYVATRQCHWRDNRNTRGTSTPVLSY